MAAVYSRGGIFVFASDVYIHRGIFVGFFFFFSVFLDFYSSFLPSSCQLAASFPPFLSYLLGIVGFRQVGVRVGGTD